eukprot:TRINITY_DN5174_c0_g1_i1.p2 TRINITY_DN5174_c0_g1~~TRINITY_DN5174_c0_g1_i1.p2  ORF type:complete len:682 (-),score=120.77 TRINITY_DN5174_c0_g1_i1:3229-5274(-)
MDKIIHNSALRTTSYLEIIRLSFYREPKIFLRELIRNGFDALDKVRFDANGRHRFDINSNITLKIELTPNKSQNTLTIRDTGVGMTKKDLINYLGKIGVSGYDPYQDGNIQQNTTRDHYGIGFYSSFLVADKVEVITKHNDDEQYIWTCYAGDSHYTIARDHSEPLGRGTKIILHMKDYLADFLNEKKLRDVVSKYAQFNTYPIILHHNIKDVDFDEFETHRKHIVIRIGPEVLNMNHPIWLRHPNDIHVEEYACFYKSFTGEYESHTAVKHFTVDEAEHRFTSLLFVPARAPYEFSPVDISIRNPPMNNIKIYLKSILVTESSNEFIPGWLSFVKGLVVFDDHLPLNISKESIVRRDLYNLIRDNIVNKSIELFGEIEQQDEYIFKRFYDSFSDKIKVGLLEVSTNDRVRLSRLLRYYSTYSYEYRTSLSDYIKRMQPEQEHIYYIVGQCKKFINQSPFLESLRKNGIEVLLMYDTIDEHCMKCMKEYEGISFKNVAVEGLSLAKDHMEQNAVKELKESYETMCRYFKDVLVLDIGYVTISERLTSSPCVIVTSEHGWSANMERIMKAKINRVDTIRTFIYNKNTLEINPTHPIIVQIKNLIGSSGASCRRTRSKLEFIIKLLFETALITSGFVLEDPVSYANNIFRMNLFDPSLTLDEVVNEEDEVITSDEDNIMETVD